MEIHERLAIFYRRLEAAAPATNADEALNLVCRLIEQVEDEFCAVPREEPPPLKFTGRMYPPQQDRVRRLPEGGVVANTRRHRIYCQPDGTISIVHVPSRKTVMTKDGRKS
ncbi:MAG TPA: hypothetical protein VEL06_05360 [Haliangiales bacterium]|nr:hypothetical protein [Haliangiales bacterium]